jgi:D-glycero-alpha-D-manno-heptose-7-phosphate kinase
MRVSFAGGGTDFPSAYANSPGLVVSAAIDWRVHVIIHPLDELATESIRCSYAQVESVLSRDQVRHPVIRGALQLTNWDQRIGIYTWSDIPARNGLGGSSAFAVALLQALYASQQIDRSQVDLASDAVIVERELANEPGGVQDHFAAAFGGVRAYSFSETASGPVATFGRPVRDALSESLCLIPLGARPSSAERATAPTERDIKLQRRIAQTLHGVLNSHRTLRAHEVLDSIGRAMSASQAAKVPLYESGPSVRTVIELCKDNGSLGEKLTGAGGGGFVATLVPPRRRKTFIKSLEVNGLRAIFPGVSENGVRWQTFDPAATNCL